MKASLLTCVRNSLAAAGLVLGAVLILSFSASAQELLKNANFEAPFPGTDPKTNWTIVYADGGPADFAIAGQTTEASRGGGGRGAHIRPNNYNYAHAYFKQVVTNITDGSSYTLSAQKMQAGFQNYIDNGKLLVYMSAVSGSSSNVVFGNADSVGPYSLTITGASSHQIEVQLHLSKSFMAAEAPDDMKHAKCSGWFDDLSLKLTP